jgi:ribosomal protein L37AE/L43A
MMSDEKQRGRPVCTKHMQTMVRNVTGVFLCSDCDEVDVK